MQQHYNWRIVQTKPGAEKKVCDQLIKKEIGHYLPLNKMAKKPGDRHRSGLQPLFPQYIFAHITSAEETLIKTIDGVKGFIFWKNDLAVVHNEELENMRRFVHEHNNIRLLKIDVANKDAAAIVEAPEHKYSYQVIDAKNNLDQINISSLGFALVAEKVRANVDVIQMTSSKYSFQKVFNSSYR